MLPRWPKSAVRGRALNELRRQGIWAVGGIIDVVIIFGSGLIGMVISIPYFVVTEALFGATLTTFLLRLRVVKADGSPIG